MRAPGFVAVVVVAVASSAPNGAVTQSSGVTPFERGHSDIVLVAWLNGRGPFRLLLDTGSTHSSVSAHTAEAIGAPLVARAPMGSVAGSRMTPVVRIDALRVGPVSVDDLLASVLELSEIPRGEQIDGVIGQDVLASLRYTIDFRQRRIDWFAGETMEERGRSLELQPSGGRFVIPLPQGHALLRLVPDTGAASVLLFAPYDHVPVTRSPLLATLTTPTGETNVSMATLRELRVGALTLRNVPAVLVNRDRSEPAGVDGLLPLHLFDRVTVDGPRRRLIVEKT